MIFEKEKRSVRFAHFPTPIHLFRPSLFHQYLVKQFVALSYGVTRLLSLSTVLCACSFVFRINSCMGSTFLIYHLSLALPLCHSPAAHIPATDASTILPFVQLHQETFQGVLRWTWIYRIRLLLLHERAWRLGIGFLRTYLAVVNLFRLTVELVDLLQSFSQSWNQFFQLFVCSM